MMGCLFLKRWFKVQRSGFKAKHTPPDKRFFMRHWVRHKATASKINDTQRGSESASGSGLAIEVGGRYIKRAHSDTDIDAGPETQTLINQGYCPGKNGSRFSVQG
jgi:hypothetical protein